MSNATLNLIDQQHHHQQQQQQQQKQQLQLQQPVDCLITKPDNDVEALIDEKNRLISCQYSEIERLQRELSEVIGERDALLCEVSKFKFELEMADLKRLHDDR